MMQDAAPRSLALDYAVGICCVWISGGFFLDAWAHGHVPVESFFTPYHAVFYSGMAALAVVLATFALRGRRDGRSWGEVFPQPYRLALLGIPIFVGAGIGDFLWHHVLGIEEGVDALLSPTHQVLGLGIFFISSGPIRSVLYARSAGGFAQQAPLALGLATWLILVHFGTAYAFDPGAGRTNAPPPIVPFTQHYLTALAIGYYKLASGVLIVIFQSTLIAGFSLWLVSRMRPSAGMFTSLFVLGNLPAAAAFTNRTPLLAVTLAQSILTGILADWYVRRYDPNPSPQGMPAFRFFGAAVPMTYIGVYLLGTLIADGIWWDWNVALGSWIWSGVCGFALTLAIAARRTA
ncbi:MAG TPA: hypothetical protein VGX91_01935 [Candidatus Cybelea sp.]|nr:hypothetical protein [Candidatus Cybelea sp.]